MNPLSFVTFFTFGELGMMSALAVSLSRACSAVARIDGRARRSFLADARRFHLVIGDLFQQYAAKYVGISRGIPLSNTNQLWGLLWGILVFGELHGRGASLYAQVIGGSLLMMMGVGAIALSSATGREQSQWKEAARREGERYDVAQDYVEARMDGRQAANEVKPSRGLLDWLLVAAATFVFVVLATMARVPQMSLRWGPAAL